MYGLPAHLDKVCALQPARVLHKLKCAGVPIQKVVKNDSAMASFQAA